MKAKFLLRFTIIAIILVIGLSRAPKADAYYGLGMMGGLYGLGMYGLYGMYGLGMMGGLYGLGMYGLGLYGLGSPFSIYNMYYPIDTGTGLTYQLPFMMAMPYIGISSLYRQLFPNLFNPSSTSGTAPAATATAL